MPQLELIHKKIGFSLLRGMQFEKAGSMFLLGNLHPLILIWLFPDLAGNRITSANEIAVYSGVVDDIKSLDLIDSLGKHPVSFFCSPVVSEAYSLRFRALEAFLFTLHADYSMISVR